MDVNGYLKDASGSAIGNATAAPLYVSVVGGSRILPLGATGNILWFNGSGVWATVAPPTTNYNYVTYSTTSSTVQWSTISHYQISNLQGGTTSQYYHLTSAQQASVAAWNVATASHNHNIWQLTGYSTQNADTVDNFHATSFIFATTASATGCLLQYVSGTWASLQPGTTAYQVLLTQATGATCYWGDLDCGTSGSRKCAFQLRRDTALNWYTANPTLMTGGIALETDTHIMKTGDGITQYNSLGFPIVPYYNYVDGDPRRFTLSQLAEGFFFRDDFSNDTSGQYTGTFTISAGNCTITAGNNLTLTKTSIQTYGKFSCVFKEATSVEGNSEVIYFYYDYPNSRFIGLQKNPSSNTVSVKYRRPQDTSSQYSVVYTGGSAADACTYMTTIHRIECDIRSDGTFKIYVDEALVVDTTWTTTPTFSGYRIGRGDSGTTIVLDEITVVPAIAFSDAYASDTEARYHQLASTNLTTWAAAAAGDVAVSGGALVLASDDDRGLCAAVRSYNFKSGEIECSFDNNNDGGGGADTCCLLFGYQDINNYYRLALEDDAAGAENLKLYKVVAGSATQIGSTKDVSSVYTRSNKTWVKVQWDAEKGRIWAWLRDNAGTYPTTPDISDAFSSAFSMGKVGFRATVTTAGAGNLSVAFDDLTVRCNCLIGETNVPATETGFYLRDEFSVDSWGRFYTDRSALAVSGGSLNYTGTTYYDNAPMYRSFQATNTATLTETVKIYRGSGSTGTEGYWGVFALASTVTGGFPTGGYMVRARKSNGKIMIYKNSSLVATSTGAVTFNDDTWYWLRMTITSAGLITGSWSTDGTTFTDYITYTDTTYTAGYSGLQLSGGLTANDYRFDDFTISGTRYYNKPMLRGAQLGEWWDGSKSVYGTRFTDDYDWNSIGEYTGVSTSAVDTANGYLTLSDTTYIYPTGPSFSAGSAHVTLIRSAASGSVDFTFCNNVINITYAGAVAFNGGAAESWSVDALSSAVRIVFYASGTSMEVWSNGVLKGTKTGLTLATSNFKMKRNTANFYILSLQVNGYDSTAKLGLNLTLGGVPHGARYDTQEYAALSFTNRVKYGTYKLVDAAKCTATATTNTELYFANSTDSATISTASTFTLTFSATGTTTDFVNDIMLLAKDRNDTITLQARRQTATTDNSAAVFIEYNALVPLTEVATV